MKLKINEGFNKDLYCIKNTNSTSPAFFAFKSYDENTNTAKVSYFSSHTYPDSKYLNNQDTVSDRFGRTSRAVFACLFDSKEAAERVKNIVSTSAKVRVQNVYNTELFSSDINKTVPINTKYGWCLISTDCPIYKQHKDAIDSAAIKYLRQNYSKFNSSEDEDLDIKSKIKKAVSDYKGSSRKGEPTDITSYRDDQLSFEFEGISSIYDVSIANAFVNKYLAKYKLEPEQIDILDFTDEDDRKIGKAIVCRF